MKRIILICLTSIILKLSADDKLKLDQTLHDGSNNFTARMFNEVAKENVNKSFVLSAFSTMSLLGQVALASVGESHDEILNSLGMPNDEITKAVFSYTNSLRQSVKKVTIKIANKIYVEQGGKLNETFAAASKDVFGSEVENVNFREPVDTANKINQWVENQTNHVIKELVGPEDIKDVSSIFLINAIYFKGDWKSKFDKSLTTERDFYVSKSKVTKVQMMRQEFLLKYTESQELDAQVLELPYADNAFSLVVVLPQDIEGINVLEEKLNDLSALDRARGEFYEEVVEVSLPRFKIETSTDLKIILERINVSKIFDDRLARIENLVIGEKLSIGSGVQKAFIEVNEEGTEAVVVSNRNVKPTNQHLARAVNYGLFPFAQKEGRVQHWVDTKVKLTIFLAGNASRKIYGINFDEIRPKSYF